MKCSYCLKEIEQGTGFVYVRKNGAVRYFCTGRCKKMNLVYNRKIRSKS